MSISSAMNNAISGLSATSRMAEVVSSNVSNALTDGYARRELMLSSVDIGGRGGGVKVDGIRRIVDQGLLGDRRLADASMSNQLYHADTLSSIERLVGLPGDAAGLAGRLAAFEASLISAGSDPASELRLAVSVERLGSVAATLQQLSRGVQAMRQDADAAIERDVATLNTALAEVETLNADITRARVVGGDPSALQDARQRSIDRISDIVPLRVMQRDSGAIALMTTSGAMLLDGNAAEFSFDRAPTIVAEMTYGSGALSGIYRDGAALSTNDGFGRLSGGSLAAAFMARDQTLTAAQAGFDDIAADLIQRFENPVNDPSLPVGGAGLLTDKGGVYDALTHVGLAGRIAVNAAVDPAVGGLATRLRDGVGAVASGAAGDATQINRWIAGLNELQSVNLGQPLLSASGLVHRFGEMIGTQRLIADEGAAYQSARWDTLYQAELADGVDTDVEMQKLLLIEQSYAANAKLIQTASAMIQTLMEI